MTRESQANRQSNPDEQDQNSAETNNDDDQDTTMNDTTQTDGETKTWEIGISEADDRDDWRHYHPRAESEEEAVEKAMEDAGFDFFDPHVYMVEGPFEP